MTRILGIIGDPIEQVRSPSVFNALFQERQIDAVMVPMHVQPSDLERSLAGLRTVQNLSGLVVTVPHKIAAASLALRLSERAKIASAVNVLRPIAEGWEGDLFDGEGFSLGMKAAGHGIQGKSCAIVGCGGAGAAIAVSLVEWGVASLALWDSDRSRCERLSMRLECFGVSISIRLPGPADDVAINATPLGMADTDPLPIPVDSLRPNAVVADVIMKPPRTRLLEMALGRGLRIHEGRHMLDSQIELIWNFFEEGGQRSKGN